MAAPKLAMAGKHMAQPMADTTAPNELALSPMRVKDSAGSSLVFVLYCFTTDG